MLNFHGIPTSMLSGTRIPLLQRKHIHLSQALITPLICMHLCVRRVAGLVLPHTGVLPMFSLLTVHILTAQLSLLIMHIPPVLSLLTVHILPAPMMQPPCSVYPTSTQSPQGASPAGTMQPPHSPYPTSAMHIRKT